MFPPRRGRKGGFMTERSETLLCCRCNCVLDPRSENIWRLKYAGTAGPFNLELPDTQSVDQIRREIEELTRLLEDVSEREAIDSVHSFGILYFCTRCFYAWREDPGGEGASPY